MDTALQALLSYQFILLCLAIAAITYVFRLAVQFFILDNPKMPGTRTSKFWRDLILPISPVFFGVIICLLVKTGIYPEGIVTQGARVNLGLVAGLLSGLVYKVVVGMLGAKLPATDTTATNSTPTPVVSNPNPNDNESIPDELKQLSQDVSKTISKE